MIDLPELESGVSSLDLNEPQRNRNLAAERGASPAGSVDSAKGYLAGMVKFQTIGLDYAALRKECLEAVKHWPGCESVAGIQIVRGNRPGSFSVRITLYGIADVKT